MRTRPIATLVGLLGMVVLLAACQPYAFQRFAPDGRPVRWGPCATVHYQIDPAGGRLVLTSYIHDAFAAASAITGIPVRYDGRVDASRPHQDGTDPVWVSYEYIPGLNAGWTDPAVRGDRYVGGVIYLDPTDLNQDPAFHRRAAFHEVGHLFGLAHAPADAADTEVMGDAPAPFHDGDIAGLRALGRQPKDCPKGAGR